MRAAGKWWRDNRPKAPEAFDEEIDKGFELASGFPSAGEPVAHPDLVEARRLLLNRIHYHLYYCVSHESETVEILAIWHTSRGRLPKL